MIILLGCIFAVLAVPSVGRADVAPTNTGLPTVSGPPQVGQTLTAANGSWAGDATITYAYQWRRCDSSGANCTNIGSATGQTYLLVAADVAAKVRVAVTGTNSSGSSSATSDPTPTTVSDTYLSTVLTDSPYAFFHLSEATGATTIVDSSGAGRNASGVNHTQSTDSPVVNETNGRSGSYNGSSRFENLWPVDLHAAPFNDRATLEAWIKPANTSQNGKILSKHTSTSDMQMSLGVYNGKTYGEAMIAGSYVAVSGVANYSTSVWMHVALVYDGTRLRMYEKGVEVANAVASGALQSGGFTATRRYAIGRISGDSAGNNFNGLIDEVAIYSSALSATRVFAHYKAGNPNGWPVSVDSPSVSGTATQTWSLSSGTGTWTNSPETYDYQWQRCSPAGFGCIDIPGAGGASYAITSADVGVTVRVRVDATNSAGSTSAYSGPTAAIGGTTPIMPSYPGDGGTCPTPWQPVNAKFIDSVQWLCDGRLSIQARHAAGPLTEIKPCVETPGVWPYNSCGSDSQSWDGIGNALSFRKEIWELFGAPNRAGAPGNLVPKPNCTDANCFQRFAHGWPDGLTRGNCAGSIHAKNPSQCLADPINGATGGFRDSVTDLKLAGIGLPFSLTRSYNSENAGNVGFGRGWSFSYGPTIAPCSSSGSIMFYAEDGQAIRYQRQPDGSYTGPPGGGSTLAAVSGGFELKRKDQVTYHFDNDCHLTWMRDRNSNQLTFNYGSATWLTGLTDTAGRTVTISRGANGQISAVTLPDGRHVDYGYTLAQIGATDSAYLLTAVTDTRGGVTHYTYDSYGRLTTITDPLGHRQIENIYAVGGRVTSQKDALDHQTTFSWDNATQTLTTTDARAHIWKDIYADNQLSARTDPQNHTTNFGYGPNGNLTTITDPRSKTTTMTYDSSGNLLTKTAPEPLSYTQIYTYNDKNDVVTATDGRNHITNYGYDSSGNLSSITRPENISYSFGRDTRGLVTSITDPLNKSTTIGYDSAGNRTSLTSPLGTITTYTYDSNGRLTGIVDPRGNVTGATPADYTKTVTYNAADDVSAITDALGNTTTWIRDLAGNVTSKTDPNSHTNTYGYSAVNQLTSITAPGNAVTAYTYDGIGDLLTRTDPNSHTTTFAYDTANRLTTATTPTNKQWSYQYDESGNVVKIVDAVGNDTTDPFDGTTTLSHDALDRVSTISYSDSSATVQYGYDGNGNRTSMADEAGTQIYTYDALDRLTQVARGADTFSYGYDAAGRLLSRVYPGARETTYSYNDDSDLVSATSNGVATTFTYDVASQLTRTDFPSANGYTETRQYDRAGRLTEVRNAMGSSTLSFADYTYDAASNPTTATRADGITSYTYDSRNRLTEVCHQSSCPDGSDPFIRYVYDPVGNRTSESKPAGTTLYNYDAADQLTSTTGPSATVNYSFDADGNQTQAGTRTFTWGLSGTMTSTTADGATTNYSYDGDGNLLQLQNATSATNYLWDLNSRLPQLALERNGSGSITSSFLLANNRALSMDASGSTHYFLREALGSVVNLVGADGHTEWTYSYEPFGEARTATHDDPAAPSSPLRFAGEQVDSQTAQYNLRARKYDPQTGRFISQDPLPRTTGEPSVSMYLYADNQPTAFVDPSGMGKVWPDNQCDHWYSCALSWARDEVTKVAGWNAGCARSTACLLGAGANVASFFWLPELRGVTLVGERVAVTSGMRTDDVLEIAETWLGPYREIAPGVYRSYDDARQFRMTTSDLTASWAPHVHFESPPPGYPGHTNIHVPLLDP